MGICKQLVVSALATSLSAEILLERDWEIHTMLLCYLYPVLKLMPER